jgi:hypothetical protein
LVDALSELVVLALVAGFDADSVLVAVVSLVILFPSRDCVAENRGGSG